MVFTIHKLKQIFCKHKNIGFYRKSSTFHNLSGERVYKICEDCGKVLDSEFVDNNEFCRRFNVTN